MLGSILHHNKFKKKVFVNDFIYIYIHIYHANKNDYIKILIQNLKK